MLNIMNTQKTIYLFGNPLLEEDSLPLRLVRELQGKFPKINFVIKDPHENLWPTNGKLVIIDTAVGIERVQVLTDLSKLDPECSPCSLHDFDLALNLKLLEKIGELKEVTIFAVPQNITKKAALRQLIENINKYVNK